jgi:hypothetical protein
LLIENSVNILKTFGSCLVLAMLAIALVLPHWPMEDVYAGQMRTLVTKSQENILLMPSLIVYSVIESAVSLVVEPSLDPGPWETEVCSQTPADQI